MEQTVNIILKELREFRTENNKRWEENDKKWEENERRWEENERRWEENERRWDENDKKWKQNDGKLEKINQRLTKVENDTKSLKKELIRIFEATEEAVEKELKDMNDKLDITNNTLNALLVQNIMEHKAFVNAIKAHETKINLQNVRIENLESWKAAFGSSECVSV